MSQTWKLFERWQAAKGYSSVRQAAMALGVDPSAATLWKNGRNANADVIEHMANELGESPAAWAALVMQEQSKGEAARAWGRIARQLGAAAVIALAALLPSVDANANASNQVGNSSPMHIMSIAMRWLRRAASYAAERLFPAAPSALLADT